MMPRYHPETMKSPGVPIRTPKDGPEGLLGLAAPRPFHGGIVRRGNLGVRGRENIPKVTV